MTGEKAAAIAVSLLFFVCCVLCVASKIRTGFRLYLLLGLSTLLRGIGFAIKAAQYDDPLNTDLAITTLVFRQAGFGISIAVLCILMGCWFKNADERGKPPPAWPLWSVGVRLLIAPVIVFGPICGVAIAILYYVEATPSSIQTATRLREGSSWAFLGVVSILHTLATIGAAYVLRWQWREAGGQPQQDPKLLKRSSSLQRVGSTLRHAARDAHSWVHWLQVQVLMLQVATIFRVVSLYHPQYATDPNLFYPLQVLPELLYVVLLLLPNVMVHVGMVGHYDEFVKAVKEGRPYRGQPGGGQEGKPPSSRGGASGQGGSSTADVEAQTAGLELPPAAGAALNGEASHR